MIDSVQHLMRGQTWRTVIVVIVIIINVLMRGGRLLDPVVLEFMREPGATETPYDDVRHEYDEHQKCDVFSEALVHLRDFTTFCEHCVTTTCTDQNDCMKAESAL